MYYKYLLKKNNRKTKKGAAALQLARLGGDAAALRRLPISGWGCFVAARYRALSI